MEADNFARYLKGSTLSSLAEAVPRRLSPGGRSFPNGAPDAANEALFENGLQQYVADARRGGLFLDVFIRIAGNQDDRSAVCRFRRRFARSMPVIAGIL